jgi:membrane protease YdiL (CAAX protease family)
MLFAGLGFLNADTAYQETADALYSVSIPLGLVLYGIAAPLAEELLFRGIIFQEAKKVWKPLYAAMISAGLFGMYHGNGVQMVYGFCMGMILGFAYHQTHKFSLSVIIHGVVNVMVFLASNLELITGSTLQLVAGTILTAVGIFAFWKMNKEYLRKESV